MNKYQYLAELDCILVRNNFDLPTPGRESNLKKKFYGPDTNVQEKTKEEGRLLATSLSLNERLIGYGLEAYAHYFRSLESAIDQKRKHPEEFSDYFPHWLHSSPDYLPKDVYKIFANWFANPNSSKIKNGQTYWKYSTQHK